RCLVVEYAPQRPAGRDSVPARAAVAPALRRVDPLVAEQDRGPQVLEWAVGDSEVGPEAGELGVAGLSGPEPACELARLIVVEEAVRAVQVARKRGQSKSDQANQGQQSEAATRAAPGNRVQQ